MKRLDELFTVAYGNKLDMNKMRLLSRADGGVNFVGRSSRNHGVSGAIATVPRTPPNSAGLITVALGGSKLLASFVQEHPFYTAQNVAVLAPLEEFTAAEKIYICLCIRHNRFRYSAFGREANRTLPSLLIPDRAAFPAWLADAETKARSKAAPKEQSPTPVIDVGRWGTFTLGDLFDIKKGKRLTKAQMRPGGTPFIGAIDKGNGRVCTIAQAPLHPGNTMTVNYNGNGVAETFYQPVPFRCSDDVHALYPRFRMTPGVAMFLATVIRREKYRFSYGRKWHLERMVRSEIRLPAKSDGNPDWEFMELFVNTLPFSSQL